MDREAVGGESLVSALARVPDHREASGRRYPLNVVLGIAVAAMLSGARSLYAIAQWAREHRRLLVEEFGLPRAATPCHATFHRVFKGLDVAAFESVVHGWLAGAFVDPDEAVAVDGKTLRGIHGEEIAGVHLVAAYAHRSGIVIGQAQSPGKGHEVAATREVLTQPGLLGRTLTVDALYAARPFCQEVVDKGGTTS